MTEIKTIRVVDSDGDHLGTIRTDQRFPNSLIGVYGPNDERLFGTPFAAMGKNNLRAWAEAFQQAADTLTR